MAPSDRPFHHQFHASACPGRGRRVSHHHALLERARQHRVARPGTMRYGDNTACIEVREVHIVFDCGTGIRPLGEYLACDREPVDIDPLLTHSHLDHISGLPFFAPAFDPASRLRLWAGHLPPQRPFRTVLADMMTAPLLPVPVKIIRADCQYRDSQAGETLDLSPGSSRRHHRLTGGAWRPQPMCPDGHRTSGRWRR